MSDGSTAITVLDRFEAYAVEDGDNLTAADKMNLRMCLETACAVIRASGVQDRPGDEAYTLCLFQLALYYWEERCAVNGKWAPPPAHLQGVINALRYGGE